MNKNERICTIIDITIPGDKRVSEKENENNERYQEVKKEIKKYGTLEALRSFKW